MNEQPLHIQLLGTFRLHLGGMCLSALHAPRIQALLAYLVLHRDAPQLRRTIAFSLWPSSTEAQALTNLRNLLHQLRHHLPQVDTFVESAGQTLQWRADSPLHLDTADFEAALKHAATTTSLGQPADTIKALEAAIEVYGGDLLPGCYDDWILPKREQLRQQYLSALEQLVTLLEAQRDFAAAIPFAQRIIQLEPLQETAYLQLLRLHALAGNRAAALQTFQNCAETLYHELGVDPGAQLVEACERLRQGHSPDGSYTSGPDRSVLVGRRAEWQQMAQVWHSASGGCPHLLILSGDAGIGKTRLAEELLGWVSRQGFPVARAQCYPGEEDLVYAPVIAWFRTPPVNAALAALPNIWLSELVRLLPDLGEASQDPPPPRPLNEPWQRQRLFDALVKGLLCAGQPLLLLLDDVQWCDETTLDWLRYLLHSNMLTHTVIVCTLRPYEVGQGSPLVELIHTLRSRNQATVLEIGPLTITETTELAAQVSGQSIHQEQGLVLYRETEGNPLFVVEMVRASKCQCPLNEVAVGGIHTTATLPTRVEAVITRRLGQLSPPAHRVASLAAVIGRTFTFPVLARACYDMDEDTLLRSLEELLERRIIYERPGGSFDFSHGKLREIAYRELSETRRRRLHRQVVDALAAIHLEEGGVPSLQLALHYEQVGRVELAAQAYVQAAAAAQNVFAARQAADYCRRAVLLLSTDAAAIPTAQRDALMMSANESLGEALVMAAENAAARQAFADVLALTVDMIMRSRMERLIGNTWRAEAQIERAEHAYQRAQATLLKVQGPEKDRGYWQETIALHNDRINLSLRAGRATRMTAVDTTEHERLLMRYCTPEQQARGAHLRLLASWWQQRCVVDTELLARSEQVVRLAETAAEPQMCALILCQVSLFPLLYGELDKAESLIRVVHAAAEQMGNETLLTRCLMMMGLLHRRRGMVEECRDNSCRYLFLAEKYGLHDGLGAAHADLAWVALRTKDTREAERHGRTALEHWQQTAFVYPFQWTALLPLLAVALDRRNVTGAVDHARALAHPLQQQLPAEIEEPLATAVMAATQHTDDETADRLRKALAQAERLGFH